MSGELRHVSGPVPAVAVPPLPIRDRGRRHGKPGRGFEDELQGSEQPARQAAVPAPAPAPAARRELLPPAGDEPGSQLDVIA